MSKEDKFINQPSIETVERILNLLNGYCDEDIEAALWERRWRRERQRVFEGYVYLCRNNRSGYIKIGFSKAPAYREKTLQAEEPDVEFIEIIEANMAYERELHQRFGGKRLRGEWFRLTAEDIEEIRDENIAF